MELEKIIDDSNCVYCTHPGKGTDTDYFLDQMKQAISRCRAEGIGKILWDYQNIAAYPAAVERIIMITELASLYKGHLTSGGRPIRFAFYTKKNLITKDFQPGLDIARLEGLDMINTDDEAEIKAWIERNGIEEPA